MKLVPFSYNLRSLFVRRTTTVLTVLGIGSTVAIIAGVLALQQGFARLFTESGREDLVVVLRQGATTEGDSGFSRERADVLKKSSPEIAIDDEGRPLASLETYLAVRRFKRDGGETNVPIRGVQEAAFALHETTLRIVEGRRFEFGTDEVIVGSKLTGRIRDCRIGDVIVLNTTPFRVVGVFEHDGPFASEIWSDVERMSSALERPVFSRMIAKLKPGITVAAFHERLQNDVQTPAVALTEREYLVRQTQAISSTLFGLAGALALIMGIAAVFTATNTMLASVGSRTREIGILLAIGYRPFAIFLSFLLETILLGLLGGAAGSVMTLPLNGIETGTTNFQTFTEVAFAFRVTLPVLLTAIGFSLVLGVAGGAWPSWKAARLRPTEAMRRA